jgi:pimeloyl-ACP methyl ester carboxylesterase
MTTRRHLLKAVCATAVARAARASGNSQVEYGRKTLATGIRSRRIDNGTGLKMHVLEAGFEPQGRPCVVLLHGFPELAYTWRHQMVPLAKAGFHVVAPDLRGYGRSAAAPVKFDDDLEPYQLLNRVGDVAGVVHAFGYEKVAAVVGHDWGAPTAAWCALTRPDMFQSVVLMSTPFAGTGTTAGDDGIEKALETLPRPRKHYWWYYASPAANEDLWHPPQGVHDLLRAYYYYKSADWKENRPFALKAWTASELAKLPEYYVMDRDMSVAATMAAHMPSRTSPWMTEDDLRVYSEEYLRTGFQGGLNSYRVLVDSRNEARVERYANRTIDVPSLFIGGASDWGVRQSPGAFEEMQKRPCTRLLGVHLVAGAGHSIPEEQPGQFNRLLLGFLRRTRG